MTELSLSLEALAGADDASIQKLMGALAEYTAQRQTRNARQAALDTTEAKLAHYRQLRTALALCQAEMRAAEAAGVAVPVLWPLTGGNGNTDGAQQAMLTQAVAQSQQVVDAARAQAAEIVARARQLAQAAPGVSLAEAGELMAAAQAKLAEVAQANLTLQAEREKAQREAAELKAQAQAALTAARTEAAEVVARARKMLQDAAASIAQAQAAAAHPDGYLRPRAPLATDPRPAVAAPITTSAPAPAVPTPPVVRAAVPEPKPAAAPAPAAEGWEEWRHGDSTAFEPVTIIRGPTQFTLAPLVNDQDKAEAAVLTGVVITLAAGGETDERVCAIRKFLPAEGGMPLLKGMAFTLTAGECSARIEAGMGLLIGQSRAIALHLRYRLTVPEAVPVDEAGQLARSEAAPIAAADPLVSGFEEIGV